MLRHPDPLETRETDHPVEPIFPRRWSPRAMSGELLTTTELYTMFEAARWAPSTFNEQEWRFLYGIAGTPHFDAFLDLLVEANQQWARQAAVLMCICSKRTFTRNGKPNPVHSFDAGAAWENLALQGAAMGLVVHGMAGFDFERAARVLRVPDDYKVEAMAAVGRPGDPNALPDDMRDGDLKPTGRKPLHEIACEGAFAFD